MRVRNRNVDRAIRRRQRGIRRATAAVVVIGLGGLVWAYTLPEQRQGRRAGGLEIGDDSARITERFGAVGRVCPVGALEHLRDRFPEDTPPATAQAALERMRRETARRRVIPLPRGTDDCLPDPGATEIGIDRDGRVLWIVPLTGRTPLRLPDDLLPSDAGDA